MLPIFALGAVQAAAVVGVARTHARMRARRRAALHRAGPPPGAPPPAQGETPPPQPQETRPPPSTTTPPGVEAPFPRPSPPPQPVPPEKPDFFGEAEAVALGTKMVTGVLGWTPFAPVTPLLGALGKAIASWSAERERAEKAQPFLRGLRSYATLYAPWLAIMERWPLVDALYSRGDWEGCKRAEETARAAGAKAYQDVCAQLDAMEVKAWRDYVKNPDNKPAHFSNWNRVIYRAWAQGAGGFTGRPKELLVAFDVKTDGEWHYTSLVDGVTREYSPRDPDGPGKVVPRVEISPEALARLRAALEARETEPRLDEQLGHDPGQEVRDLKDRTRGAPGLEEPRPRTKSPKPAPASAPQPARVNNTRISRTGNVTWVTTDAPHHYRPGLAVLVDLGPSPHYSSGRKVILATPGSQAFTYAEVGPDMGDGAAAGHTEPAPPAPPPAPTPPPPGLGLEGDGKPGPISKKKSDDVYTDSGGAPPPGL
jgi:hypothetical protein